MMRPFKHVTSDILVTGRRRHIYQSCGSTPLRLVKKLYIHLCLACRQALRVSTMTSNPQVSVQLPRCDELQQPQTISSNWLAASGATRPGTFRLIDGLALLKTTPTLDICLFPAPEGHASDSVFHNHPPQMSDGDDLEATNVARVLPCYCALSCIDNQPSTPASPDDNEPTQFQRWLTLSGPTQSFSINIQVLEDAARAAYECTKKCWLWVDTLCVMPDDDYDMRWHLEHRSQIFSNAERCIVLLDGLGRHGAIEERTNYFSTHRTLLDVVCPKPEDVMVLHSWPDKYGSGQWYLPQPTVMATNVRDCENT